MCGDENLTINVYWPIIAVVDCADKTVKMHRLVCAFVACLILSLGSDPHRGKKVFG